MISDIPLIVWGFVSLLVFPFVGLLSVVKIRATPYLVTLLVIWAIIGLFIVGGGITPMGHRDIVTKADRNAWLQNPKVIMITHVWFIGIIIGILLLLTTLVFEKLSKSRYNPIIWTIVKIALFVFGFIKYMRDYILHS